MTTAVNEPISARVRPKASAPTLAYFYEVTPKPYLGLTIGPLDYLESQLGKARGFKNKLIELERQRRDAFASIRRKYCPELETLEAAYSAASLAISESQDAIKARNARERRKRATPEEQRTVRTLKEAAKEVSERLKACKARANESAQGDELAEMEAMHKDAIKAARAAAVADDLYTFTANGVLDSLRDIRKGAPPEFRKWDGSGFLYLQVQAQAEGYPPLHWEDVLLGRDTRLQAEIRGKYTLLRIRLGSNKDRTPIWVSAPIVLHRTPPPNAIIKGVRLNRRRCGRQFHWSVSITLANSEGWQKPDLATCGTVAVDLGRRSLPEGLRVAVWRGDDGATGELWIPRNYHDGKGAGSLDYARKPDWLQSDRTKLFNKMKAELAQYLDSLGETISPWLAEATANLSQWTSKNRLLTIVNDWQAHAGDEAIRALLVAWRAKEIHLERWEADQRQKFQRWRKHFYLNFWAMLRRRYATILLQKINWTTTDVEAESNEDNTALNFWKATAADGDLDAAANARTVRRLPPNERQCPCGCAEQYDKKHREHACSACGLTFDVDHNDTRILLERVREGLDDEAESDGNSDANGIQE
jgi:hypothetical protein